MLAVYPAIGDKGLDSLAAEPDKVKWLRNSHAVGMGHDRAN